MICNISVIIKGIRRININSMFIVINFNYSYTLTYILKSSNDLK